jgi:hypothetical protein
MQTLSNLLFVKNFKNIYTSVNKTKVKQETKKVKIQTSIEPQSNMTIKEIPYNTHKERIAICSKMQNKFDKVTYDEDKKLVICYNKVYGT